MVQRETIYIVVHIINIMFMVAFVSVIVVADIRSVIEVGVVLVIL